MLLTRNLDVGGRCFVDDYFGLHILENDNVENQASQNLLQIGGVNPIYALMIIVYGNYVLGNCLTQISLLFVNTMVSTLVS